MWKGTGGDVRQEVLFCGGALLPLSQNVGKGKKATGAGTPTLIFGWKDSFFGDLHALGKDAVHFYAETKVVTCRWPE